MITIRQQLWGVMVFVTCACAIFLWMTESATYIYSIKNSALFDYQNDETRNNSEVFDWEIGNLASDAALLRANLEIMTNGTGTATVTMGLDIPKLVTNSSKDATNKTVSPANYSTSTIPLPEIRALTTSPTTATASSHSLRQKPPTVNGTAAAAKQAIRLLAKAKKLKKIKSSFLKKPAPPFRWCFNNETLDKEISEELPCDLLFDRNENYNEAKELGKTWASPCEYSDEQIAEMAAENCTRFRHAFNFVDDDVGVPASKEELEFPLAYVMVVEKWAAQVIRILSAVYRSHNLYCITYDAHATAEFKRAVNETVRCLRPNVITPEEHIEIYWADFSLLNATMNCMRVLSDSDHQWRYVQILSYNDFPLRTNAEMVRILKKFNGANDAELTSGQASRYAQYHKMADLDAQRLNESHPLPPAGLVIYKGSFAATMSREFIRFVFDDKRAQDFLEWSATTWAPEEQFWATLIHNEHVNAPGRFPGACLEYYRHAGTEKLWISRFQVWYSGCEGKFTSASCVFGVGDLPMLAKRPELIAHKFYQDFEPATFYCLARRHYERVYVEEKNWEFEKIPLNSTHYESLPAVRYQRMKDKEKFACGVKFSKKEE